MDLSKIHKEYLYVDKRPKCAKCRAKPADVYEDHYFFCATCALEQLNLDKKKKNYKSNTPK